MAVDAALLQLYPALQRPTLRLYGWSPPCLSLGIAQRFREVRADQCAARGITVVRRPTGGRAILHDQELTYALVTAQADPLVSARTVGAAYARISQALVAGIRRLGVDAEFAPPPAADTPASAACFDVPAEHEIIAGGRKLVGSAQARKAGALLQHGAVLLHADPAALAALLHLPPALGAAQLGDRLVALDELLGARPAFDAVAAAVVAGFADHWGVSFEPAPLTAAEEALAAALAAEKFGAAAWTERR